MRFMRVRIVPLALAGNGLMVAARFVDAVPAIVFGLWWVGIVLVLAAVWQGPWVGRSFRLFVLLTVAASGTIQLMLVSLLAGALRWFR